MPGANFAHEAQVPGGGEPGHVDPDLGDDHGGGDRPDAGDLIEARRRLRRKGPAAPRSGHRRRRCRRRCPRSGTASSEQEPVVVVEMPVERLLEPTDLGAHPGPRQLGEHLRVAFPGHQRGHHRPPGHPEDVGGHHREFDAGVLQQLLDPVLLRRPRAHQIDAVAGQIPQPPDRPRRHETGPQHLAFGDLAQPDRIQHIGLGPARQVLDVAGVDQPRRPARAPPAGRTPVSSSPTSPPSPPARPAARPGDWPARSATGSSSNASTPPAAPSGSRGAGTRTQHTNSALPISRAATLAMICSSSWDSANIAVISSLHAHQFSYGAWSPVEIAQEERI